LRTNPRPEMAMPRRRWRGAGTNRPRRGVSGTVAFGRLGLRLCQTISERGIVRTGTLGNLRKKLPAPSSSVAAAADLALPLAVASDEAGGEGAVGVRLHRAGSVRDQRTAHICPAQAVMPAVNHRRKLKECCWRGRWAWLWTRSSWRCRGNPSPRRWRRRGASCRPPRGSHRAEPAEAGRGGWCDRDALGEQTIQ